MRREHHSKHQGIAEGCASDDPGLNGEQTIDGRGDLGETPRRGGSRHEGPGGGRPGHEAPRREGGDHDAADGPQPSQARYIPLFWRALGVNVLLLIGMGLVTIAVLPDRFSRLAPEEAAVLALALVAALVANTILLRRALQPLRRLAVLMSRVDPLRRGTRAEAPSAPSEIADLATAFNRMLDDLEHERRESTRRAVAAQESERLRIAQELHDDVGQTLTAVVLQLARLRREAPRELETQISTASDTARDGIESIRRISQHLRPEALDDLGLPGALSSLCERLSAQSEIGIECELAHQIPSLPPEMELVIYRVAQEAVTNALRHSGAQRVMLKLRRSPESITLSVEDDGRGLPAARNGRTGGLQGMRERAALIGASLEVSGRMGGGVAVRLTAPI